MLYPCDACPVDVMCTTICDNLIFFSDLLTCGVQDYFINTRVRMDRLRLCILKYGSDPDRMVRLDNDIIRKWNTMKNGKEYGVI